MNAARSHCASKPQLQDPRSVSKTSPGRTDRNELVGAHRFWSDWTPVAGQQYGYNFDNLGNRNTASSGGDIHGANLRTTSYSINALNEYTSINTPGYAYFVPN